MARLENAALTGAVDCNAWWVAKGKIPTGNIQPPRRFESHCYGSKRWLALTSFFGARGSQDPSSTGTGQSCQFDIWKQWWLFVMWPGSSSHLYYLKLVTYLWEVTIKTQWDIGLSFQGDWVLNFGSAIEQLGNLDKLFKLCTSVYFCPHPHLPENKDTHFIGSWLGLIGSIYM